jgi:hypothetical protein
MHVCYNVPVWTVRLLDPADGEYQALLSREKTAMTHAMEKLEALGPLLSYPHSSDVRGVTGIRELRPRAGRSPWRAFYRRIGSEMVIGAVGPEAESNPSGFHRAVRDALQRLENFERNAQ